MTIIGLHGNVCYPINTGWVTYYEQPSCCLVKYFVHMTKDSGYNNILQDKTLFCAFETGDIVCWLVNPPLQSWTCSSRPTVDEFVKLTQSISIEIQRQSADLYKVQLCNRQFFVGATAIYVVKVCECHPLDMMHWVSGWDCNAYQRLGSSAMLSWMFTTSFDVMQLLRKLCISSHDLNFTWSPAELLHIFWTS